MFKKVFFRQNKNKQICNNIVKMINSEREKEFGTDETRENTDDIKLLLDDTRQLPIETPLECGSLSLCQVFGGVCICIFIIFLLIVLAAVLKYQHGPVGFTVR